MHGNVDRGGFITSLPGTSIGLYVRGDIGTNEVFSSPGGKKPKVIRRDKFPNQAVKSLVGVNISSGTFLHWYLWWWRRGFSEPLSKYIVQVVLCSVDVDVLVISKTSVYLRLGWRSMQIKYYRLLFNDFVVKFHCICTKVSGSMSNDKLQGALLWATFWKIDIIERLFL